MRTTARVWRHRDKPYGGKAKRAWLRGHAGTRFASLAMTVRKVSRSLRRLRLADPLGNALH
ncbi:hypothetical protein ABTE41_19790, partial [Acinetobacter baumannii]